MLLEEGAGHRPDDGETSPYERGTDASPPTGAEDTRGGGVRTAY